MAATMRMSTLDCLVACGAFAWFAALAVAPAAAAPADDMRACIEANGDAAISSCTRAIGSGTFKERELASLYAMRGSEFSQKGQHDRALADYDRALGIDTKVPSIYIGRGNAYFAKGDSGRAIADFDQAIKVDPQFAGAYQARGNAFAAKGAMDDAIASYGEAIRVDSQSVAAYVNRGNAYLAKGDPGRALSDYDQALRLDPQLAPLHSNRGMANLRLGQFNRAVADFDAALKLNPDQPLARYGRGVARQRNGDAAGGKADTAVATMLQPNIASTFARAEAAASGAAPAAAVVPPVAATASARQELPAELLGPVSIKVVFEKYNLLGFFARDCSRAAGKDNLYFVNRLLDANRVQTDQMSAPTSRDFVILFDKAGEIDSNEVVVSGTREGKPVNMLWRVERDGAATRVRPIEASWGREKLVTNARLLDAGRDVAWLNRCG